MEKAGLQFRHDDRGGEHEGAVRLFRDEVAVVPGVPAEGDAAARVDFHEISHDRQCSPLSHIPIVGMNRTGASQCRRI